MVCDIGAGVLCSVKCVSRWTTWLCMLILSLTDIAVIFPLHIPIPHVLTAQVTNLLVRYKVIPPRSRPSRRHHVHLNFITVPLVAVLILLASRAIDGTVLKRGIVGADGVKPINIMALFISLVSIFVTKYHTGS